VVSLLEIVIPVEATGLFSYAWLMIAIPLAVSAILLLGTFNRRPWVVGEGEDERLEIRTIAKLTLTIDHRVLDGEHGAHRDIVVLNAAAGLLAYRGISTVKELVDQLRGPLRDAQQAIDSGAAARTLEAWIAATRR